MISGRGEVSITDAAHIQTALHWEKHGSLCQRWLTKDGNTLKPTEKLQFSEAIAKASAQRDKAIAALDLGRKQTLTLVDYVKSRESA